MIRRCTSVLTLAVMILSLVAMARGPLLAADGDISYQPLEYRKENGDEGTYLKAGYVYDSRDGDCLNGQDWCLETVTDKWHIKHIHFGSDWTATQKEDHDRWLEKYFGSNVEVLLDANAHFNCHSYALCDTGAVMMRSADKGWVLRKDFKVVTGVAHDPYKKGHVLDYVSPSDHTSKIEILANATGAAKDAALKTIAKWRLGAKVKSHDHIRYGEPGTVYKRK